MIEIVFYVICGVAAAILSLSTIRSPLLACAVSAVLALLVSVVLHQGAGHAVFFPGATNLLAAPAVAVGVNLCFWLAGNKTNR
jgi:hypothetical protein